MAEPYLFFQAFHYFATSSLPKAELVSLFPLPSDPAGALGSSLPHMVLCGRTLAFMSNSLVPAPQCASTVLTPQTSDCSPNKPGLLISHFVLIGNSLKVQLPFLCPGKLLFILEDPRLEIFHSEQLLPYNRTIVYFHSCFCLRP